MIALEAGITGSLYRTILALHILLSIAGFGAVLLNGVYAAQTKKRPGPEGRAISEANYAVSSLAEWFIISVPVSGLALVWASDGAWELSQTWVWLSIALVVVALVVSRTVLMPGHRRLNRLLQQAESDRGADRAARAEEIDRIGARLAGSGGFLHLMLVVIIVLMIWKPGA